MRPASLVLLLAAFATASCDSDRQVVAKGGADQASSIQAITVTGGADARQGRPGSSPEYGTGAISNESMRSSPAMATAAAPPMPPGAEGPSEQLPTTPQSIAPAMVIRTGDARIEVDSLEIALGQLRALAQRLGGFIGNTNMQLGERETRQATVEVKIPAERFDAAQAGLDAIGKVEYVNVAAQDVGEEFVDITARVDNAKRLEQRIITLLATRTGRLEEVLSAERELARIRETIERYEGRLRYLRTRVAVSTMMVTLHEEEPLVGETGSGNRIVEAFKEAWRNFVGFIALFIESLGWLLPLGVIVALVAWWIARHRGPPNPPTPPARPESGDLR